MRKDRKEYLRQWHIANRERRRQRAREQWAARRAEHSERRYRIGVMRRHFEEKTISRLELGSGYGIDGEDCRFVFKYRGTWKTDNLKEPFPKW